MDDLESLNRPTETKYRSIVAPLITGIIMALVAGGGVYAYERHQKTILRTTMQTEIDLLQSQVDSLNRRLQVSTFMYVNDQYNFQVAFSNEFTNLIMQPLKRENSQITIAYGIYLPTDDPTYANGIDGGPKGYALAGDIGIFDLTQWASLQQSIKANSGNAGYYDTLGSNSKYYFAYESSEIGPNDWPEQYPSDLKSDLASFRLN